MSESGEGMEGVPWGWGMGGGGGGGGVSLSALMSAPRFDPAHSNFESNSILSRSKSVYCRQSQVFLID